jgi:tetratricopeptide (TPR) repeat protein
MQSFAEEQQDEQMQSILETHCALLARCRAVGVPQAFADISHDNRSLDDNHAPESRSWLQEELDEIARLRALQRQDLHLTESLIQRFEALLHSIDSDEYAELRARIQYDLGSAYTDLPSGDHTANLQQAIACYQQALRFFTPEVDPVMCRLTNGTLADVYFRQADWSAALVAYQAAIDSGERLYRASVSSRSKAKEVVKNTALYRKAAFAAARLGDPAQALLLLERGKTRLLNDALSIHVPRPIGVPDAAWDRFTEAGQALRDQTMPLLTDKQDAMGLVFEVFRNGVQGYTSRFQQVQAASAELAEAVEQVRVFALTFLQPLTLATVRSLLPDPQTALLAFCLTQQGSLGAVCTKHF